MSNYYIIDGRVYSSEELYHHGVKGMKWGIRRYQNKDGSLTAAGRKRAENYREREIERINKRYNTSKLDRRIAKNLEKQELNPTASRKKRLESDAFNAYCKEGMRIMESSKVRNMSVEHLTHEMSQVKAQRARNAVSVLAGFAMTSAIGVGVASLKNIDAMKTNMRVTKQEQSELIRGAKKGASDYLETIDAWRPSKKDVDYPPSGRTESKRVASIKERVTGKKENGKPAFLMTEQELAEFDTKYETRRKAMLNRYNNASDSATKQKIRSQLDKMEEDYLSVVEQDFWYSDDQ